MTVRWCLPGPDATYPNIGLFFWPVREWTGHLQVWAFAGSVGCWADSVDTAAVAFPG